MLYDIALVKQKGFHSALAGSNYTQTFQFKENQFVCVHYSGWFVTSSACV